MGEEKCCDYNLIKTKINLTREIIQKKVRRSEGQVLDFDTEMVYMCLSVVNDAIVVSQKKDLHTQNVF